MKDSTELRKALHELLVQARLSAAEDAYQLMRSPKCCTLEHSERCVATQNLIHDAIKMLDDIYTIELAKESVNA